MVKTFSQTENLNSRQFWPLVNLVCKLPYLGSLTDKDNNDDNTDKYNNNDEMTRTTIHNNNNDND